MRVDRLFMPAIAVVGMLFLTPSTALAVDQYSFIETVGLQAKPSQEQYGVPPSVSVAQAILESAWGQSSLAVSANNYFGIKCRDGTPGPIATGCIEHPTRECNAGGCYDTIGLFRSYASVADSIRDHGRFLYESPRYAAAFQYPHDADQFIREVHAAGYATDPEYSNKIINLMQVHNLYRFN